MFDQRDLYTCIINDGAIPLTEELIAPSGQM